MNKNTDILRILFNRMTQKPIRKQHVQKAIRLVIISFLREAYIVYM